MTDWVTRLGRRSRLKYSDVYRSPAVTDDPPKKITSEIFVDTGKFKGDSFVELEFCTGSRNVSVFSVRINSKDIHALKRKIDLLQKKY